jgi:cellulose synthase/poly-beta-1,6-N-acetylglucosamine synthase-like glycosyltransferase/peptidoglycan/xylan/chitin deacetylase (PgdA/CDA1 family)/spore germination protein YaaH
MTNSVFLDPSGRRWRRLRFAALATGVVTTLLAALVVASIFVPPLLPEWRADRSVTRLPALLTTRKARERLAARRRLFAAMGRRRAPAAVRAAHLPLARPARRPARAATHEPITAGFYVNWDDNSYASFAAHAREMDWVVCEWSFIATGGDSLRFAPDRRIPYVIERLPDPDRPLILAMVSNFDSGSKQFGTRDLRRLLATAASRARAVAQLDDFVRRWGLGGVTVDFENVPDDLHPALLEFVRALRTSLAVHGAITTMAIGTGAEAGWLREVAAATDDIFLMLYDEHYGSGDPGPVASVGWYAAQVRQALRVLDPAHTILAIGAYGYDWNDAGPDASGGELTFQDVMAAGREHAARVVFDSVSLNPYLTWTDPDSTDHVAWYLDAATAWNQSLVGDAAGAAGRAIWRLGSEDPALWRVIGRHRDLPPAAGLAAIPPGYDVEFDGDGEILRLSAQPTTGHRGIVIDSLSGLVRSETIDAWPSPWVVRRDGRSAHRVALTFDDGPDGTWTPIILDTLRAYHAPGTFFVIGENVERHIPIMRRLVAEGHEFGNHTFTHPNLALTSAFITRLQLDATERLLEAVTGRRSAFFRPPYFGDAEPTDSAELVPVSIASELGYVTAGLHVDAEDWEEPGVGTIVDTVLQQRRAVTADRSGNVILLHDGGGDRAQTVAALGPLIDSLRARGDTLVLLSELAGIPRDEAMARVPVASGMTRFLEFATFGVVGAVEWLLHWIFLVAVALGVARLAVVVGMAVVQRAFRRPVRRPGYAPVVSVVVPAFNEARVIGATVQSLLAQQYDGEVEIVVVDDGSPDDTAEVARAAFGGHPRVSIYRKSNGGKASALNYGIARARGEIVVGLDADTVFLPGTLAALVAPLADPRVAAVAGNAKVGNRVNLVTRWQALEYVTSQNLDRRALSLINAITVVPGAVGAWRKSVVESLGGFSHDTLAEDQDLTIAVRRAGHVIAYADDALALTEAPDTLRALARQRFRWSFGTLQCMWKHRDALFDRRTGSLGLVAMPNTWIFQLLFPAISPVADLLFLWSLVSVWLVRQEHGATYAVTDLMQVLTFYAVFLAVDWLAAVVAFLIEPGEDRTLTWLIFLQRFAYRQVMYWVVVRAFVVAIRGRIVGWGKLERKATVRVG